MLTYGLPLAGFEAFRAESHNQLGAAVDGLGARILALRPFPGLSSVANKVALPNGELWFCSYGVPLRLAFRESNYTRLQLAVKGAGWSSFGRHSVQVAGTQCCISSAAAVLDFGPGFQQIAWRVHRDALLRKVSARLDRAITRPLEFRPSIRLDGPLQKGLEHTLRCLIHVLAIGNDPGSSIVAELEQALMAGLLFAADHNLREALDGQPPRASPAHLRLAEEYIAANWAQGLCIDEVAAAVNVSVRSLYRTFQTYRGYSPMEFLKQCRLNEARRMLTDPGSRLNVTAVAMACGFGDLSHFSKDFASAFGEPPSAVARRRRVVVEQEDPVLLPRRSK